MLAAEVSRTTIRLREKARGIDHEFANDAFTAIEEIASKMAEFADKIAEFDPMKSSIDNLYRLEGAVHGVAIEMIGWESTIEEITGFWGTGKEMKKIEQVGAGDADEAV